jgi:hypothetical protein
MFLPDMEVVMETRDLATNSTTTRITMRATITMVMGMATDMTRATVRVVVIIRSPPLLDGVVGVLDVGVEGIPQEEEVAAKVMHMKVPIPRFQTVMAVTCPRMLLYIRHLKTPLIILHHWSKHLPVDAVEVGTDIRLVVGGDLYEEEEEVALLQDGLMS